MRYYHLINKNVFLLFIKKIKSNEIKGFNFFRREIVKDRIS